MTLNPGKFHYMVIDNENLSYKIMLNNNEITGSNEEKLLGKFLGSKVNFKKSYKLSLQKNRSKNRCPSQVKELPYIRSKKLIT